VQKAYSTLEIKKVDAEQRIIEGIASNPSVDRQGDVMVPSGAQFSLPVPFLWQHNSDEPIGEVFEADVKKTGIYIKAKFSKLSDAAPAALKERVETAWHSISAKPPLVRGLSIGWKGLEYEEITGTPYFRWVKWIWGELSAVTIPANVEATILAVKHFDQAASGPHLPGDTGTSTVVRLQKAAPPMTTAEQITQWSNTRAPKAARMAELMAKSAETGTTLDQAQSEEYDGLEVEIKEIDKHLLRLKSQEQLNLANATKITDTTTQEKASEMRGGNNTHTQITVKSQLPAGTSFARMCMAMAAGRGDSYQTLQYAKQWKDSTPEVEQMVEHMWHTKASVAAGTTTDSTWAAPLVVRQPLNEFLALLRPRTLLGRVPGLRQVPFNISMPNQTTGGTYGWVGQNKPKPVTKADYATVTVDFAKAAGIIVISEELAMLSTPSAEGLVREEMLGGMSAFLDTQFVDPAIAAVANVNPASITNGAATIASSGVTGAAAKIDLASRVAVFVAANIPVESSVWLMNEANAFGIGLSVNALGQPLFPGFNGTGGGSLMGIPVVVSNNVGARVVLVHTPSILYADEGGVRIDVSREASVQMDSAPTDTVDATTVYLSLWQRNLIGLKAERFISWTRARAAAVTYITTASPYIGT
jgi:HK97 family phage major capsid protein